MAAEPLISSKRFGGGGGLGVMQGAALPLGGYGRAGQTATSPIPLEYELAFERGEISGRTYKQVVDQALDAVAPGTTMYRTLMREQSQAMRRMEDEEEKAIREGRKIRKLQAQVRTSSTIGNTYADAVYMYDFWMSEAAKAAKEGDYEYGLEAYRNAGNQSTIADARARALERKGAAAGTKALVAAAKEQKAQWKVEDSVFEQDVRAINELTRQGVLGTRKNENGEDVNERAFLLGRTYQTWKETIEARIDYLEENPELNAKMTEEYSAEGLKFKLEGGITRNGNEQAGINDLLNDAQRFLEAAPSSLALIANPDKNRVDQVIAPADIKSAYIKDEYGINHKVSFTTINGQLLAVSNVLKPDGTIVRVASGPLGSKEYFNPNATEFYFEGSKTPITRYSSEYHPALDGSLALTGAKIDTIDFIKDVLNIDDPEEIQTVQADIKFQQLAAVNPELKSQEALLGASGFKKTTTSLYESLNNENARYYGTQDQVMAGINEEMRKSAEEYRKLRNEGILEGNADKLKKSTEALDYFKLNKEKQGAELAIKPSFERPLPIITPRQERLVESSLAPAPLKGNIRLPSLIMPQEVKGTAPVIKLGPTREQKPIILKPTKKAPKPSIDKKGDLIFKTTVPPPKPKKPVMSSFVKAKALMTTLTSSFAKNTISLSSAYKKYGKVLTPKQIRAAYKSVPVKWT